MKMKRLISWILAAVMIAGMLTLPAAADGSFTDVAADAWYAEAVKALNEKSLMNGVGSGRFDPQGVFTRAQLATVLYRMAGSPKVSGEDAFDDTQPGTWYSDAVLWASQNRVILGYGNSLFGTNDPTTQEQLTVMLWRDAGERELDRAKYASTDGVENQASQYAFDAVVWAKAEALIYDLDAYAPKQPATRAQVADMVYRYLKNVKGTEPSAPTAATDTPQDTVPNPANPMILNADGSFGGTLNAAKYGEGAPKNGRYDVADSPYYTVDNDYYNMPSTEERLIYPQFASYQQTMQDSDGIACLLMILHYMGKDVKDRFSELALTERYEQLNGKSVYGNGATADGMSRLVQDIDPGYKTSQSEFSISGVSTKSKANMKAFLQNAIRNGKFVLVRYQSPNGYRWKVVIGYDTLGKVTNTLTGQKQDAFGDDVMIFADPYDCCDHRQDGYSIERAQDFIVWWRNMTVDGEVTEKYSYLVIDPGVKPELPIKPADTAVKQKQFEIHLPLNPDGTYGGTRDADLYGTITSGRGWWDHPESNYYKVNDFYNMGSSGSRVMLPRYTILQQTMHSSCGVCSVTAALKYYGRETDSYYDLELKYAKDYERLNDTTIKGKGTGIKGNVKTVEDWGYKVAEYHTDTKPKYRTCEELLACFKSHLEAGRPIVVLINFGSGHYMTVIGVDDMGTDTVYDDVIVTADSCDYWNGCQDGYDVFSAYKFFSQFTSGSYKTLQGFLAVEKP